MASGMVTKLTTGIQQVAQNNFDFWRIISSTKNKVCMYSTVQTWFQTRGCAYRFVPFGFLLVVCCFGGHICRESRALVNLLLCAGYLPLCGIQRCLSQPLGVGYPGLQRGTLCDMLRCLGRKVCRLYLLGAPFVLRGLHAALDCRNGVYGSLDRFEGLELPTAAPQGAEH